MSRIDIRTADKIVKITNILFHDARGLQSFEGIELINTNVGNSYIKSNDGDKIEVNKDNVDNLILALQKAKELGWFEE
jgi:hypothetical protein